MIFLIFIESKDDDDVRKIGYFGCRLLRNNEFLEWCSLFKFNILELVLGMDLKFYTSLTNNLKLTVKKILGLILTFGEVRGK